MISRPWTAFLFSLACASTIAWLVALLHEKNVRPVQDLVAFFKKQSKAGRVILGAAALSLWAFASTKQGTSEVGEVEGSATLDMENEENRRHGDREEWVSTNQHESAQISIRDNSCQFVDKAPTGGEETPRLPSSNNSVFSDSNSTPGYLLTHVGTNEVFSFDPPDGAIVCADWRAFGAAEDWICLAFPDWAFRFDANEVDTLRVHSDGWGEPLVRDNAGNVATSRWLAPFRASLGIVPEVNWPRISTNLHESVRIRDNPWTNSLASLFWHCLTPSNTLVLTWRDALLHRSPANPVSFQAELFPDGRLVCRYDLSRLVSESVTNATVGASLTGRAWMTNAISASVTSLHFHPLDENDRLDSDADSDGLLTADEIFVHGTDPHRADSDADGLSDPDELVAGTDPRNPDTDGDGLLDGEEVSLGTGPLSADGDADGLSDFAEVRVHGTNPNRADTDGDGIPDADEVAGTTNPVRADTDGDGLDDAAELRLGTSPGNPDTDGDGAPDGWEVEAGSDPFVADTDGDGLSDGLEWTLGSSPLLADSDGDGLGDFDELSTLGTSPARADTDGDGLDDPTELRLGTNPCVADTDGDGLNDGGEIALGTDPLNPDTDGDGLEDGMEIEAGASPFKEDADGDGMPDAWEVRHGLAPASRSDASADADRDGLSNLREFQLGTSPLLPDTDGDGRSDSAEFNYGTSPVLSDTDGDGLDDGDEYRRGTSGMNPDTDGDGLPDGWEVRFGLDPKDRNGLHGASGDPDGDGLSNAEEHARGTHSRLSDTDGDGIDDGEEVGCLRRKYLRDAAWASTTNGWTAVEAQPVAGGRAFRFEADDGLCIGSEQVRNVICQWNGIVLVETDRLTLSGPVEASPQDLSGGFVSSAALTVAPCWTEGVADAAVPSVAIFRRGTDGCVRYAIQYAGLASGTNAASFQATLVFTNGAYWATEVVYGADVPGGLRGVGGGWASVGVQDAVQGRRWSAGFGQYVAVPSSRQALQFISGTGTNPTTAEDAVDSDGDGLPDTLERQIGTDPFEPDTDGDGLHDGWEHSHGFDPKAQNGEDGDSRNDADADPDGDGLTNGEEADWGTDPHNDDTDGDGVPDGVEVEQSSDPADATDGGRPASRVPVAFTFGDPSGSHSEKYRLVVKPSRKPDGQKPASVEEPRSFEWVNAEYGACETKTAMLLRGWTYEVRMFHAGTDIEDGSPDYDYSLSCLPPSCVGVVTNDPQRLFGSNGNSGESFEAEGKVAEILVLDGCLVGDYDRRDGFTDYDLSRVYRNRPLRHWINDDDDDGDTNEGDGDIPGLSDPTFLDAARLALGVGREPDYFNGRVDGRCDILDFTPVWIDMGRALRQLTTLFKGSRATDYALTLSQPEGAVNVVWTSLSTNNASRFLSMDVTGCGESLDERLEAARTVRLTKEETRLPDAFVEKMREDRANGVFLFEGRALENGNCLGTKFITLRCYRKPCTPGDGSHLFELKLPVSISPVEDMFRWVDERWVCGDTNGIPTRLGSPWNNPDSECDGTHYVFVHGYNVSAQSARGWAAEMFKRLRQSGSQAMFTAVDWYGNDSQLPWFIPKLGEESPNYYVNVEHAFDTAWQFAQDFNGNLHLPGRKIVLAHSLGNVLASSAAKDFDLQYGRYYMLNAAVPMEAYDSNAFTNAMIDCDWRALTNRVHSTDWWRLFAPSDGRQLLTWRGRFDGIKNAVNCYSPGEDTLGNITDNHGAIASMWNKNFWAAQELNKGTKKLKTLPESWGHAEGGWGFNPQLGTFDVVMGTPTAWLPRRAARRTDEELIRNPIFRPFDEAWLCSTGNVCSNAVRAVRARILADGIPATSFAAGANELKSGVVRDNINYTSPAYLENGYPRGNEKWRHSSLKQFAYYFAFRFFEKIVEDEERSYEP